MIKRLNKATQGQTALILILLTAAALIFLAITLNWGRVAQTKALLTIAADESASTLGSDAASYGEMQKQTYLKNKNEKSGLNGVLLAIVTIVVAIVITVCTWGTGAGAAAILVGEVLSVASIVMAVANLVLQLAVVGPMITAMWNKLQKNQPIQQQFFEEGITTALQGSVGDQVNITDYFDLNTNGVLGNNSSGLPKDSISRFAFFYTDRLRMLNQQDIRQVVFFANQLGEFMNGETCAQNASDNTLNSSIPINPLCSNAGLDCTDNPSDANCQLKIPGGFQLNDACTDSDPSSAGYNPYCDPCCQPATVPDPDYDPTNNYPLHNSPTITVRPSNCPQPSNGDDTVDITQCKSNNPYGSSYPYIYDPTYQNYADGVSFLAKFGRDQQVGTPKTSLTPQGNFPNGIYPFFWLMRDYSAQVDNIDPTQGVTASQAHWCATGGSVSIPSSGTAPAGFTDLAQLNLPYTCQGKDCCVNYFANSVANGFPAGINPNVVMDMVGAPPNPAADPSFGIANSTPTTWQSSDNQFCSTTWPYNGSSEVFPDGSCEWTNTVIDPTTVTKVPAFDPAISTIDSLDDTMHTLSDFTTFANGILGKDIDTLSSTFNSWYPQAAAWIAPACTQDACNSDDPTASQGCTDQTCNAGTIDGAEDGRLLSIYDPAGYPNVPGTPNTTTAVDKLGDWNTIITNWLQQTYTNTGSWCVPPQDDPSMNANGGPTIESSYIATNGAANDARITANDSNFKSTWGDLGYVTACMNYNAGQNADGTPASFGPVYNYQQCLSALTTGTCPTDLPDVCASSTLGRSLAGPAPTSFTGCDITQPNSYAKWVSDSLVLFTNEAPKFVLRAKFLNDIYTRAQTMKTVFEQGDAALKQFFLPCSGNNCEGGGPAAQLIYARSQPQPVTTLPNAVIYGWVDNPLSNGQPGYAHIVKVTAYSPGRAGSASFVWPQLPWIRTHSSVLKRYYTLTDRDGFVYVSVKRWDEDHSNATVFPNGHPLWQFMFHNPQARSVSATRQTLLQACKGPDGLGFGLENQTLTGLQAAVISGADQASLSNAFMLNDEGDGKIDPNATGTYSTCLSLANTLLQTAPESHACVQYIASNNASKPSGTGDHDYSLKFVTCPSIPQDDLTTGEQ